MQSYRVYDSQVNRLTDIVRCSVDCSSFADILKIVKVRSRVTLKHFSLFLCQKMSWLVISQSRDTLQVLNQWGCIRAKECLSCRAEKENSRNERKECASCVDRKKGKIFEILRVRNRFFVDQGGEKNSSGGYRDISFKIKVGFQVHTYLFCMSNCARVSVSTCRNLQVERRIFYQCELTLPAYKTRCASNVVA
jgi:hypothetical protein